MKKGFTLLELLIVIGILAILATAATLVLNPAQLLAQARDSQRIADLDAVRAAIALYLTDVSSPVLNAGPFCIVGTTSGFSSGVCTTRSNYNVSASTTNWIGIDLTTITGGSPLAILPKDPSSNTNYFYAYAGNDSNKTYELNSRLESIKYRDKMVNDGGDRNTCTTYIESTCWYEVGTVPGLNL